MQEITASGEIECTECGHTIERNHDEDGCDLCACHIAWTTTQKREYRTELGLPARWRI